MSDFIVHEDGFYYYNEEDDLIGPFDTIEQAQIAHQASIKWQVREHKNDIRKMRDHYE